MPLGIVPEVSAPRPSVVASDSRLWKKVEKAAGRREINMVPKGYPDESWC